ncbi:MAG: iron-sulfur cluster insertion protein ErpA [Dehalococcoidia bacterium]|nr:iron-sulfur cluster insertion protein ErpA [Dehalococcoidia bacterium]
MPTEIFNERAAAQSPQPLAVIAVAQPVTLVSITPRAAQKAQTLLVEKGAPQGALRLFVVGGGCSGYQYGMAIAEQAEDDDTVIEQEGVRIVVDADSTRYLSGAEIDYTEDLMKSGFTIYNPTATSSCACGSSFQTADGSGSPRACS